MTRARDMANLGSQAGSGLDASDITSGVLPSGVTGGSGLSGIILQVANQNFGSTFQTSSNHSTYQTVTNLTHTNFVVGAGNKVFITLSLRATVNNNADGFSVKILRGSTLLMESVNNFYSQGAQMGSQLGFQNYEVPGAGTYTYTVQIKNRQNSEIVVNPNATTGTSSMTLMEIKG
jgi:uracil phosphoribosyltransferase